MLEYRARRIVWIVFASIAAGCSGGASQGNAAIPALSHAANRPAAPHAIVASGGGQITATGPVTAVGSGVFTMNEGASGGYVHVYTSSSTTFNGSAPYVGENVAVSGTGTAGSNITASTVSQAIVLPSGTLSLAGPVSGVTSGKFTVNAPGYGYTYVYTNAGTAIDGGPPANGQYAQAVGPGSTSETASYVSLWPSAPASVTASGTITAATTRGFTLDVDATHSAVPVVLASSTKVSAWPMTVRGRATVTGAGSLARSIVASSVTAASPSPAPTSTPAPTPTPNPNATPTPKPVFLAPGATIGADDRFSPKDGDSSSGGTGQTVDGMPCAPSMSENQYHVHAYVGVIANGVQIALPDQIGLVNPGPISNGYTSSAGCYYDIHTHDASGMIHVESPSTAALGSSIYTLGNVLDVWGETIGPNGLGPFAGSVRVFVDRVPLKTMTANAYSEYTGDPRGLGIYSHEAIWIEIGPRYVVPPDLPAVEFYTEY